MPLDDLLDLCDFTQDELNSQRSRIQKAFEKTGVSDADISSGVQRINRYFDLELKGVRRCIGIFLSIFADLILAREEGRKKIIYSEWPLPVVIMDAIWRADPENLVSMPGMACNVVLGQFLGKLAPVTEAGEQLGQPSGHAHCPLYQTHLGAIAREIAPIPDLEVVAAYTCEPPTAAMQVLNEIYNVPFVSIDGCVDGNWGQWPQPSEKQIEYMSRQIENGMKKVSEQLLGREITEEIQKGVIKDRIEATIHYQTMLELLAKSDPQPISQVDACLVFWLINMPLSAGMMKKTTEAIGMICRETRERVDAGKGILPAGTPRVYISFVTATDPEVMKLFEESGLSIPCTFMCWQPSIVKYKTKYTKFSDKIAATLQKTGLYCSTWGFIRQTLQYPRELKIDGAIICYSTSCRLYTIPPLMMKKSLQKEFDDFPVLLLEGEVYDNRNYSAAQIRTRVETFAQLIRPRRS
jgi:benzoyl-CoA reductase/2-hydroxyglutaryl-CoA dehydratase subunit BcrC/BadD/HgdB